MEPWIHKALLNVKRNHSVLSIVKIFKNTPIDLSAYDLLCTGRYHKDDSKLQFRILRILDGKGFIFNGNHTIQMENKTFDVSSLRTLKKEVLGFHDQTPFERTTFLIERRTQQLIRLRSIKRLVYLPSIRIREFKNKKHTTKFDELLLEGEGTNISDIVQSVAIQFTKYIRDIDEEIVNDFLMDVDETIVTEIISSCH